MASTQQARETPTDQLIASSTTKDGSEPFLPVSGTEKKKLMTAADLIAKAEAQQRAEEIQKNPVLALIPEAPKVRMPEFSVISCSVSDERFNQIEQAYKIALSGEDYELIRISDATGLCEGYNRGIRQARGRIFIFTHDDAAPLRPIGSKLRAHLRHADIVGGAGSDRLDGPAWFTAGPPHCFGQVLNRVPGKDEWLLSVYGVPSALVQGIEAIDGFWMTCTREALEKNVYAFAYNGLVHEDQYFDESIRGFHMYDVDWSHRAFRQGLHVAVATDLSLAHASVGGYGDPKWRPAADAWMQRYGSTLHEHQPHGFQITSITGRDVNDMLQVMDYFVEVTR